MNRSRGKPNRRPLIQGRLVTDNNVDFSPPGSPQRDLSNDMELDPTLSPLRLVPQLTEKSSPCPEPPSSCLDLSDVDLDLKDAASGFHHHGGSQPVMVYDASEPVRDSPHSCEMSLSVGVEASPARVVCHTPSRFDRVRNSPRPALSPLAVTVNMPSAEVIESRFKPDRLSRTLFPDENEDDKVVDEEKEIQFKKTSKDADLYMSHQSRGIIEEILAHEMGDSNIEVISLHSQSSSPYRHKSSTDHPSSLSASRSSGQKDHDESSTSRSTQKPADDCDDISSVSETCSLDEYGKTKSVPGDKRAEVSATTKNANPAGKLHLESDTPTRIKQKKRGGRQVASRYMQSASNRKMNGSVNSKGVPSSTNTTMTQTRNKSTTVRGSNSDINSVNEKRSTDTRKKEFRTTSSVSLAKSKPGKGGALKTGSTVRNILTQNSSNTENFSDNSQPLTVRGEAVSGGTEVKASTPVGDKTFPMSYIDTSVIHHTTYTSNMQSDTMMEESIVNINTNKSLKSRDPGKAAAARYRGAGDGGEKQQATQFDLDLAYARYLQWQFLEGRARQAFLNQQKQASAQLHSLWDLTQARCKEVAQLDMDVARLRSMTLLDEVLDKVEPELTPVVANLPEVSSEYSQMAAALDGTCHQLPVTDIYLPPGGELAREAMEERTTAALAQAEHLLSDINSTGNRDQKDLQQDISNYMACLDAIEKASNITAEELQQCQHGLDKARALNTRLASLRVQDRQTTT